MISFRIFILIPILLFISACADRELPTDGTDPNIVGLFKELGGNISGELTAENSPYKVTSDLIIAPNASLQIDSGIELFFVKDAGMIVEGQLTIKGNYYFSVLLGAYDTNDKWKGIKFINSSSLSKIDFAEIREIDQTNDSLGSVCVINSNLEITHSFIYQNKAVHGGALRTINSDVTMKNNIIRDNSADFFGAGILSEESNISIINNTFYQNSSTNYCGGVFVINPTKADIQNNIFYKNSSRSGDPNFVFSAADSSALNFQYNFLATGNMDPMFYTDFDLRLYYESPCKNAGNPDPAFNDPDGSRNDQGAYGGPLGDW
jgi:hypothetical protein